MTKPTKKVNLTIKVYKIPEGRFFSEARDADEAWAETFEHDYVDYRKVCKALRDLGFRKGKNKDEEKRLSLIRAVGHINDYLLHFCKQNLLKCKIIASYNDENQQIDYEVIADQGAMEVQQEADRQ